MTPEEARAAGNAHREILKVLTGLLLVMFIGMLANTIVSNAMPVIVAEIGGSTTHYTWILTSGILANTVMTAVSGKLADLYDKKKLFIFSMVLFCIGALLCGLAWSPEVLIAFRILQGTAMGMQVMLSMVIMATVIPPRERGRYNGYMGAVMAAATVSGPLIGGVIVETPWLAGWRGTFWVTIPFMLMAIWVISRSLNIDYVRGTKIHIDLPGIALIIAMSVSLLLWVSLVGRHIPIGHPASIAMLVISIVTIPLFYIVEKRSPEPVIPLDILGHRNTILAIIAMIGAGTLMFGANVFLGQYFQYGRGYLPAAAGLITLPMMFGLTIVSTWVGQRITHKGVWKRYVFAGQIALAISSIGLAFATQHTNLILLGIWFFIMGAGLGASMQNLILAVQNTVPLSRMGAATSTVTFFRNFSGALGIQLLGVAYSVASSRYIERELGEIPEMPEGAAGSLDIAALPDTVESVVRASFGNTLWSVFGITAILSIAGVIAVWAMKGTSLRDTVDLENRKTPREIIAEDRADRKSNVADGSADESEPVHQTGIPATPETTDEEGDPDTPAGSRA